MKKQSNLFLFSTFAILIVLTLYIGNQYKNNKINHLIYQQYNTLSLSMNNEVSTLIQEKKNATLALALSFSKNEKIKNILLKKEDSTSVLKDFIQILKNETDFKNVWIALVDKNGINYARSWTSMHGDNLLQSRDEVRIMIEKPQIISTISVDQFDISFKALVPFFDDQTHFIGFIEVITHFNSIAEKLKNKQFDPIILLNSKYTSRLIHPFNNTFVSDHYIANKNANKKLLGYIAQKGLKYFISSQSNYVIDNQHNMLVINYTIFDQGNKVMANFLMFRPLESLDIGSIEAMKTTINLFILLSVVIFGFLFYLFSNKYKTDSQIDKNINKWVFVFFFIFISVLYLSLLQWYYTEQKETFLKLYTQDIQQKYQSIQQKFSTLAQVMFQTAINKPDVISLVAMAYEGKIEKNESRKKLYEKLIEDYAFLKKNGLEQLHFHLNTNESFIRFHHPKVYGDDLTGIRNTVEWVNTNQKMIEGFEEGRIYHGFRHVFPLSSTNNKGEKLHIGSVETSFRVDSVINEFTLQNNTKGGFLINADVVDTKVFKEDKFNYIKSVFKDFLYEKRLYKDLELAHKHIDVSLLHEKDFATINQKILHGEIFSIESINKDMLFTFIPLKNPVSKNIVAAIILQNDNITVLSRQRDQLSILLLVGISSILLLILYIYKEFSSKRQLQYLSHKTQEILDAQQALVVITDGTKIVDSNQQLLDFFGFDKLCDFTKEHECICEYFEEDEKFFHLGKVPKGEVWTTTITTFSQKEQIVSMRDENNIPHIFSVSINGFDNNFILSFSDISDTMSEHFLLKERVIHDTLTGAYNREYFERTVPLIIQESYFKHFTLGVVLLDIDHFKKVNDTYGHNRGDHVLIHLVNLIQNAIRTNDILIRWGGEEFLLLVKTNSLRQLFQITEKLRQKIDKAYFEEAQNITCSFGITLYQGDEPIEQTIARADQALYQAKSKGRNRVVAKKIH